jgi:DNA-binding MarR family transcriptional regulator
VSKQSLVTEATQAAAASGAAGDVVDEAAASAFGVNRTDLRIIGLIAAAGTLTAGGLATQAHLSPAATTTAIQRLTHAGHLTRRTATDDRRRAVVELTPEAAKRLEQIYAPIERAGRAILEDYTPEQLALVVEVLRRGERMQLKEAERIRAL